MQWSAGGVVMANGANNQNGPEIISDNNGGAIIAFQDFTGADIYVQNICYGGVPWPITNPVATITEYFAGAAA